MKPHHRDPQPFVPWHQYQRKVIKMVLGFTDSHLWLDVLQHNKSELSLQKTFCISTGVLILYSLVRELSASE